jgi:hypothetical protein
MEYLKNLDLKPVKVLKVIALVFGGIILLTICLSLAMVSFKSVVNKNSGNGYGFSESYNGSAAYNYAGKGLADLSVRNIASMAPQSVTKGANAEAFEVTDYNGSIETRNLDETCGEVAQLKKYDYVIFESANQYEHSCNYSFKVAKAHVEEILGAIKKLDPRELSENTRTIKNQVDDFTGEIEILQKKANSIKDTLENAVRAYDNITAVATRAQDAASLAKIIDSKIQVIERLTQESIDVSAQLDRLTRSKAGQLDRIDYTYFNINVYENKYVDVQGIKDSWKAAVKDFVGSINRTAQGITVGLVMMIVTIIQFALYILIVVFVVKYGWKLIKYVWTK